MIVVCIKIDKLSSKEYQQNVSSFHPMTHLVFSVYNKDGNDSRKIECSKAISWITA
jgi:hypothetical protein